MPRRQKQVHGGEQSVRPCIDGPQWSLAPVKPACQFGHFAIAINSGWFAAPGIFGAGTRLRHGGQRPAQGRAYSAYFITVGAICEMRAAVTANSPEQGCDLAVNKAEREIPCHPIFVPSGSLRCALISAPSSQDRARRPPGPAAQGKGFSSAYPAFTVRFYSRARAARTVSALS